MHEYSIVSQLLEQVDAQARQREATAIHRIRVRIGELSGVEADLLRTAYETFREHTLCAGAELEISAVPARWVCRECGREIARGEVLSCPECSVPARLAGGDEILLEQIEMEVRDV